MRVAVTGSSGKIGRAAMAALTAAGHRPIGFDLKPGAPEVRTIPVDCTDYGQVVGALSGIDSAARRPDAVVHLAGIPAPGLAPDHVIFDANTTSTHNVFTACATLGINRVVWASSETIFGLPFTTPPDFLPLDESHPDRPEYHYSLSKQLCEAMADAFVRWNPSMSVVSLRFSNVYVDGDYANVASIQANPRSRRANMWAYVDAADAGEACRLAVEAPLTGHEKVVIAAADTIMDIPSEELHASYLPEVPLARAVLGHETLLTSRHAADKLGYQPKVSWRDKVPGHGDATVTGGPR